MKIWEEFENTFQTLESCNNILDSVEISELEEVLHIKKGRDLETLIVASIEILKRNNKKCGKEEILNFKNP